MWEWNSESSVCQGQLDDPFLPGPDQPSTRGMQDVMEVEGRMQQTRKLLFRGHVEDLSGTSLRKRLLVF